MTSESYVTEKEFTNNSADAFVAAYGLEGLNLDCSVGFAVKPILQWLPNKEHRPDVIFYDGEVGDNMNKNLEHLHEQAKDTYILVIDDANFNGVVDNAKKFQEDKNVIFERTLRTEIAEDDKSWWNGLHILVIEK